jgi:uncharacterized protein YbjQ (UPF0145 family)
MKNVTKVRVVAKNFVSDIMASIRNFLGGRISQYEDMVFRAQNDIWEEVSKENLKIKWYRFEISQLTNGAIVIMFYGELE